MSAQGQSQSFITVYELHVLPQCQPKGVHRLAARPKAGSWAEMPRRQRSTDA
jgi:hypothetical protein